VYNNFLYEVETRFHFKDKDEVFSFLPDFRTSFTKSINWETWHYGKHLFHKDIILRIGKSIDSQGDYFSLGYKEKDISQNIINIRKELNENIDQPIYSKIYSDILKGNKLIISKDNIFKKLFALGYSEFMYFKGNSLLGYNDKYKIDIKLMFCNDIKYPVLLEIEKTTPYRDDVLKLSNELLNFSYTHKLNDFMLKEEPPKLLFDAIYS
jgi:hypothetical protein